MMRTPPAIAIVASLLLAGIVCEAHLLAASARLSAAEAVRAAVVRRLGDGVEVSVLAVNVAGDSPVFREARPDPVAQLGKPVRFTLLLDGGGSLPAVATIRVVGVRAVARRTIARGSRLTGEDVGADMGEIAGVPLKRLPVADELVGTRALRPIAVGSTVSAADVAVRRAVEPGDPVTVIAAAGAIEITAHLRAADGGQPGDVIRVVNPDTKRYLRARVLRKGLVEVTDGR